MSNDNLRPMSPFGKDLFEFSVNLTRAQIEAVTLTRTKPFITDPIKRISRGNGNERRR